MSRKSKNKARNAKRSIRPTVEVAKVVSPDADHTRPKTSFHQTNFFLALATFSSAIIAAVITGVFVMYSSGKYPFDSAAGDAKKVSETSYEKGFSSPSSLAAQDSVANKDPYHDSRCPEPPTHAVLNHYPVSFTNPAEPCHDFPALSARLLPDEKYPQSEQDLTRVFRIHDGDVIRVRLYIDNGAAPINTNPEMTTARKVSLVTSLDSEQGPLHHVNISFGGENTNLESRALTIMTAPDERLEVVPKSGQLRNWLNSDSLLRNNFEIGNNVFDLGDIEACWEHSLFLYYDLRVVGPKSGWGRYSLYGAIGFGMITLFGIALMFSRRLRRFARL
jgi:hypothetical protein